MTEPEEPLAGSYKMHGRMMYGSCGAVGYMGGDSAEHIYMFRRRKL